MIFKKQLIKSNIININLLTASESKHFIKDLSLESKYVYINYFVNDNKKDVLLEYIYHSYHSFNIKLDVINKFNDIDLKSYYMQDILKHL